MELSLGDEAVGRVTLVGAGPGDPDLLTLRAVRAIQNAYAILFDALIDPAILDFSRSDARRIDVGKRCGRRAMNQEAINRLIIKLVLSDARVTRLKGGDPFVFGRGGEDLDSLHAAGIQVDVVPGVTAACAAAASLRIPLTYRDVARSLHFITGHSSDGAVPDYDWRALGESGIANGDGLLNWGGRERPADPLGCGAKLSIIRKEPDQSR